MPRQFIAVALVFVSTSAAAEFVPMSGQAIRDTAIGATIELDTPVGTKIPIKHAEDGTVTGEAGSLGYILGAARDTGRWWVTEDRLCHQWSKWFDGETHCLRLKKEGRHVEWRRDDGKTGTATIVSRSTQLARQSGTQSGIGLEQPAAALLDAPPPVNSRASLAVAAPPAGMAPAKPEPQKTAKPVALPKPKVAAQPQTAATLPAQPAATKIAAVAAPPVAAAPAKPIVRPVAKQAPAPQPPVQTTPAPMPQQQAATPAISFRVAGVAPSDVLRVRKGPSTDHDPIGAIPPDGRDVRVVGPCQQEWCPVKHNGIGGWVNSYYLAEDLPGRAATTSNYRSLPTSR